MELQDEFGDLVRLFDELQEKAIGIKNSVELQLKDNLEFEELFIKVNVIDSFEKCGEAIAAIKQKMQWRTDKELYKLPLLLDYRSLYERRNMLCSAGMRLTLLLKLVGANQTEPLADRVAGGNLTAAIEAYVQDVEKLSGIAAKPNQLCYSFLEHNGIKLVIEEEKRKKALLASVEEVLIKAAKAIDAKQKEIDCLSEALKGDKKELEEKRVELSDLIEKKREDLVSMEHTLERQRKARVARKSFSSFIESFGTLFFSDDQKLLFRKKSAKRAMLQKLHLTLEPSAIKKGDIIQFGSYAQTASGIDRMPIEWLVLAREDNKACIISKYTLDCKKHHNKGESITWEKCDLRKWLNGEFLKAAFSAEEQEVILTATVSADKNPSHNTSQGRSTKDRIFLLSITEATRYFVNDTARKCKPTEYAKEKGSGSFWWLRSIGEWRSLYGNSKEIGPVFVFDDGSICLEGDTLNYCIGVRPALWINLES